VPAGGGGAARKTAGLGGTGLGGGKGGGGVGGGGLGGGGLGGGGLGGGGLGGGGLGGGGLGGGGLGGGGGGGGLELAACTHGQMRFHVEVGVPPHAEAVASSVKHEQSSGSPAVYCFRKGEKARTEASSA
jgi:hypothetical protein